MYFLNFFVTPLVSIFANSYSSTKSSEKACMGYLCWIDTAV